MNKHDGGGRAGDRRGVSDGQAADEKIGVQRIRIVAPHLHASAVLGTFFSADRTLLGWANEAKGVLECVFEIVYNDGRVISGAYTFRRKGGARPALMQYIRNAVGALCDDRQTCCAVRGIAGPSAFLERYETSDFASP